MERRRLFHAGRNRTKARVWLEGEPPDAVVVKEFESAPWWVRRLFGRRLLRREARAYRALEGLGGIARLVGDEAPDRLVMRFVDATPLPDLPGPRLSEELFDRLDDLVEAVHARGVACGDLHHRNVLVDRAGGVHLVDFAMAVVRPPGRRRGWLFERLAELDATAALRIRLRYMRREPTAAEAARLARGRRLWRAGRALKRLAASLRGRSRFDDRGER